MPTLTEPTVLIPAGSAACMCDTCDKVVYLLPRPSGVWMAIEVADEEHAHPRIDQDGIGRAHLPHCMERRR